MTEFSLSTQYATLCRIHYKTEMVNLLASTLRDFEQTAFFQLYNCKITTFAYIVEFLDSKCIK